MRKRCKVATGLFISLALFCAPISHAQSTTKKKVTSQADLPRFSYPVSGIRFGAGASGRCHL